MSLLDHSIRNAWLYNMYLEDSNFQAVAWRLYISTDSSNPFVQHALARQLQVAAREELLKSYILIDANEIYTKAQQAFQALSVLLGRDQYFFGAKQPSLFDASVFAYTHLLLDENMQWQDSTLRNALVGFAGLVEHRNRILGEYFNR